MGKKTKEDVKKFRREFPDQTTLVTNKGPSPVWNNFKIIYINNERQDYASCNNCEDIFSTSTGTKGMLHHKCNNRISENQPEISRSLICPIPKEKKEQFNEDLAEGLAQDLAPFATVSHRGFKNIATKLIEIGSVYGRVSVDDLFVDRRLLKTKYLPTVYEKTKRKFEKKCNISNFPFFASFTTDLWKDKLVQNTYLGVTCSFVDDEFTLNSSLLSVRKVEEAESQRMGSVYSQIETVLKKFFPLFYEDLMKDSTFVTDNGSNVKNIVRHWISCACHNLNLVLQFVFGQERMKILGLVKLDQFITATKSLVEFFKRWGHNKELTLTLKQQTNVRWNFMYTMLKSVQTSLPEVKTFLREKNMSSKLYGVDERILGQLIELLEPFKIASESLCANKDPTFDKVALKGHQLKDHLFSFMADDGLFEPEVTTAAGILFDQLPEKYKIYDLHYVALMLNPRYKSLKVLDDDPAKKVRIHKKLRDLIGAVELKEAENDSPPASKKRKGSSADPYADDYSETDDEDELDKYLKLTDRPDDILLFWKTKTEFRRLRVVARKVLGIPASSTDSERVFSASGRMVTKQRTSLTGSTIDMSLFLNKFAC